MTEPSFTSFLFKAALFSCFRVLLLEFRIASQAACVSSYLNDEVEVVPAQASYGGHEINRLVAAAMRSRRDIERWTLALGFFAAKGRALAMEHLGTDKFGVNEY